MEVTSGIFKAAGNIYSNNKGSILRTIIYTVGHFAIAITVLILVADVNTFSQYKLTDLLGKTLSEGSVTINKTHINTSTLSAGSYLIHVMKNDGTIVYQSIIVK